MNLVIEDLIRVAQNLNDMGYTVDACKIRDHLVTLRLHQDYHAHNGR